MKITAYFRKRENQSSIESEQEGKRMKCNSENHSPNLDLVQLIPKVMEPVADFKGLNLEYATMGADWIDALKPTLESEWFGVLKKKLQAEVEKGKTIYPPLGDIYYFTKLELSKIKVVVLGQDPYHQPGQAHGLSFSVRKGVPLPPSLKNIFKELSSDIHDFNMPNHGCLQGWLDQGVLLLVIIVPHRRMQL